MHFCFNKDCYFSNAFVLRAQLHLFLSQGLCYYCIPVGQHTCCPWSFFVPLHLHEIVQHNRIKALYHLESLGCIWRQSRNASHNWLPKPAWSVKRTKGKASIMSASLWRCSLVLSFSYLHFSIYELTKMLPTYKAVVYFCSQHYGLRFHMQKPTVSLAQIEQ